MRRASALCLGGLSRLEFSACKHAALVVLQGGVEELEGISPFDNLQKVGQLPTQTKPYNASPPETAG